MTTYWDIGSGTLVDIDKKVYTYKEIFPKHMMRLTISDRPQYPTAISVYKHDIIIHWFGPLPCLDFVESIEELIVNCSRYDTDLGSLIAKSKVLTSCGTADIDFLKCHMQEINEIRLLSVDECLKFFGLDWSRDILVTIINSTEPIRHLLDHIPDDCVKLKLVQAGNNNISHEFDLINFTQLKELHSFGCTLRRFPNTIEFLETDRSGYLFESFGDMIIRKLIIRKRIVDVKASVLDQNRHLVEVENVRILGDSEDKLLNEMLERNRANFRGFRLRRAPQ